MILITFYGHMTIFNGRTTTTTTNNDDNYDKNSDYVYFNVYSQQLLQP